MPGGADRRADQALNRSDADLVENIWEKIDYGAFAETFLATKTAAVVISALLSPLAVTYKSLGLFSCVSTATKYLWSMSNFRMKSEWNFVGCNGLILFILMELIGHIFYQVFIDRKYGNELKNPKVAFHRKLKN